MARRQARGYSRRTRSAGRTRRSYSRAGAVRRTAGGRRSGARRSAGNRSQTVRLIIQSTPTGDSMVGVPGTVGIAQGGPPRKATF